jgi:hypothetical protein
VPVCALSACLVNAVIAYAIINVDQANRTVDTGAVTVTWDTSHVDRILSMVLDSNPGANLTTYAGNDDFTGGSYIADGPRFTSLNAANLQWSAQLLDGGSSAQVVTRSQLSGNAPMQTTYTFKAGSPLVEFDRTLFFSQVPFTNTGNGLEPFLWYQRGGHQPFTYSRASGPGSGSAVDWPGQGLTDWDGRWGNMAQIAYFQQGLSPALPERLRGDSDGLFGGPSAGSRINPAISQLTTLSSDLTVHGALYLHPAGLSTAQIQQQYDTYVAPPPPLPPTQQRGFSLQLTQNAPDRLNLILDQLSKAGVNSVSVNFYYQQDTKDSTVIHPCSYTASTETVLQAIRAIKDRHMSVVLKPMVDVAAQGQGRGDIAGSPAWFASYATFLHGWADIAQQEQVEMFCVGTEIDSTTDKATQWQSLISDVGSHYKGQLMYAANQNYVWNNKAAATPASDSIWRQNIDYIGIDAYYPLTDPSTHSPNPELSQLQAGWDYRVEQIENWYQSLGVSKKILFSEVGYASQDYAHEKPWSATNSTAVRPELQAKCYEALFSTVWGKDWLAGTYWWCEQTDPYTPVPANLNHSILGASTTDPNKPAYAVLKKYYGGPVVTGATADVVFHPSGDSTLPNSGLPSGGLLVGGAADVTNLSLTGLFATITLPFDQQDLSSGMVDASTLRLYWFDGAQGIWRLAGNDSNLSDNSTSPGYHGFVLGAPTGVLGDWGLDLADQYVWANVDHASTFGMAGTVLPEPSTLALISVGAIGVLGWKRRRRKARPTKVDSEW